jgi:hypothetical protein
MLRDSRQDCLAHYAPIPRLDETRALRVGGDDDPPLLVEPLVAELAVAGQT